jgi:hypothetical protein
MLIGVDYCVAHNAAFEQSFLPQMYESWGHEWIDTMTDIPYKAGKGGGVLNNIAMNHGVFNPLPHRAWFDVITMFQVMGHYKYEEIMTYRAMPSRHLEIRFPFDASEEKNALVKSMGYRWNGMAKAWQKIVKEINASAEFAKASAMGFAVKEFAA